MTVGDQARQVRLRVAVFQDGAARVGGRPPDMSGVNIATR